MGLHGRRSHPPSIIERVIAMRLRNISYRTIQRELGVGFEFIWQVASKKDLRKRRRANQEAARAKHQAYCDRLNAEAERIRRGGGGLSGGGFQGFQMGER